MMQYVFSHHIIQSLYEAARKVLDEGKSPECLRESLEELESIVQFRDSSQGKVVLEQAREQYSRTSDGYEVAIDDGTIIDYNESDGYWIMAWCYVRDESSAEDEGEYENVEPTRHLISFSSIDAALCGES
jgi:hypothetical protein